MRPTPRRVLKSLCIVTVMGFLVMNLNLLVQTADEELRRNSITDIQLLEEQADGAMVKNPNASHSRGSNQSQGNANGQSNYNVVEREMPERTNYSRDGSKRKDAPRNKIVSLNERIKKEGLVPVLESGPLNSPPELNATFIRNFIVNTNKAQLIHNLDKFDLRAGSETLVIVVQVHNRADYLRHLVDSLRKAKNIEHSLLIFSHDYYAEEMNEIVRAIDFCPVLQIFYPYPIQIYPNEFPGEDPNDCPRNMKKAEAVTKRCNNAQSPDKYGHYREAKYSQTKHHWFWKINHVFDHLNVMKRFTGPVLFIEEDHYLVEDFIPVLQQMFKMAHESCKECSIMTLGTYDKNPTYAGSSRKPEPNRPGLLQRYLNGMIYTWVFGSDGRLSDVDVTDWVSTKHNMGMALNRSIWDKIKKCQQQFCRFDDYNWDWSLQYVSLTCVPGRLKVMLSKSPRIYHIGECGVHHKGKRCNSEEKVRQIENLLMRNKQYLYPDKLIINGYPRSMARMPKPNGGWGDSRDHELCKSFSDPATHGTRR